MLNERDDAGQAMELTVDLLRKIDTEQWSHQAIKSDIYLGPMLRRPSKDLVGSSDFASSAVSYSLVSLTSLLAQK
jgi:hypothetical protein